MAKALAYCTKEFIADVKSFVTQALEAAATFRIMAITITTQSMKALSITLKSLTA
jgi:hypothetical protein